MIYPAKYNGINFSYDFTRESNKYNFGNQRIKNIIPHRNVKYLSFLATDVIDDGSNELYLISQSFGTKYLTPVSYTAEISTGNWLYYYELLEDDLNPDDTMYISFKVDSQTIYSELFLIKSTQYIAENEICEISAWNNNSKHGYVTETLPAFGFFKFSKLKSDIFLNKKTEYEYSYGRKMILSSENQIAKRFTFLDLTMYQVNLLKWLCNCENLYIDEVEYQLASDFTEISNDENSEIMDLRADFVEFNQSFFSRPSTTSPKNIFTNNFFMK